MEIEEVAGVGKVESWESCEVPLYIVLVRTRKSNGKQELWALAYTKIFGDPRSARKLYLRHEVIREMRDGPSEPLCRGRL